MPLLLEQGQRRTDVVGQPHCTELTQLNVPDGLRSVPAGVGPHSQIGEQVVEHERVLGDRVIALQCRGQRRLPMVSDIDRLGFIVLESTLAQPRLALVV